MNANTKLKRGGGKDKNHRKLPSVVRSFGKSISKFSIRRHNNSNNNENNNIENIDNKENNQDNKHEEDNTLGYHKKNRTYKYLLDKIKQQIDDIKSDRAGLVLRSQSDLLGVHDTTQFMTQGAHNVIHRIVKNNDVDHYYSRHSFPMILRTTKRPLTTTFVQSQVFLNSIENTLLMSEKRIGPTVYDVTLIRTTYDDLHLQYVMAYCPYTVKGYLQHHQGNSEAMDAFVAAYLMQLHKLVESKLLCIDIKPLNMVMGHYHYNCKERQHDFLLFIDFEADFCFRNKDTYDSFKETMNILGYNSIDMKQHILNLMLLIMALHFTAHFHHNIFAKELSSRLFLQDRHGNKQQSQERETQSAIILRGFLETHPRLRSLILHYFPQVCSFGTIPAEQIPSKQERKDRFPFLVLLVDKIFQVVTNEFGPLESQPPPTPVNSRPGTLRSSEATLIDDENEF